MHRQEIFQVFTDLNHYDLGLCTGYTTVRINSMVGLSEKVRVKFVFRLPKLKTLSTSRIKE